ncbi:MAG: hypothetical protein M1826_006705 [Phylliscum demangeonii]|nr:MAG: hypothetical protein M1826_006705 [Phylliscum demangeonii]
MSSSVFFKFKSQKEPSRVPFDGTGISAFELKRAIIEISQLGDGTDFDLAIYNDDTNEGLEEEVLLDTCLQQQDMANATPVYRAAGAKGKPNSGPVPNHTPPSGYICYRCGEKGHWIQECPTNKDPNFDGRPRVKRTTGIPRSFLRTVAKPAILSGDDSTDGTPQPSGVMVNAEGEFVVAEPDKASWEQYQMKTKQSTIANEVTESSNRELQERGLQCPTDKRLFIDPTKTPCCKRTYCNDCITNALIEGDLTCPGCQSEGILIDDLVPDKEVAAEVKAYLKDKEKKKEDASKKADVGVAVVDSVDVSKESESPTASSKEKEEAPGPAIVVTSSSKSPQSSTSTSTSTSTSALTHTTTESCKRVAEDELEHASKRKSAAVQPQASSSPRPSNRTSTSTELVIPTSTASAVSAPNRSFAGQGLPDLNNISQAMSQMSQLPPNQFIGMPPMGMAPSMGSMMAMNQAMMGPPGTVPFGMNMPPFPGMPGSAFFPPPAQEIFGVGYDSGGGMNATYGGYGANLAMPMANGGMGMHMGGSMGMGMNTGMGMGTGMDMNMGMGTGMPDSMGRSMMMGPGMNPARMQQRNMNGMNGMNGMMMPSMPTMPNLPGGAYPHPPRNAYNEGLAPATAATDENDNDSAYFRKPVNPHRHQARQKRARPSDYREL